MYVADLKVGPLAGSPVVINMSLGGRALDAMEKAAIDYATGKGVIVVAAAGKNPHGGEKLRPQGMFCHSGGTPTPLPVLFCQAHSARESRDQSPWAFVLWCPRKLIYQDLFNRCG